MAGFRRNIRAGAVAGTFMLGASASAAVSAGAKATSDGDPRLHRLRAPIAMNMVEMRQDMPATARSLLSPSQWGTVRNASMRMSRANMAGLEILMTAERFKTPRAEFGGGLQPFDHISGRAAEIGLAWPTGMGFSLQSELLMSHMRRRLGATPDNALARPIQMGMVGVGIAKADGPSLMVGYEEGRIGRARSELDRVAALVGGAAQAGDGPRFELASGSGDLLPHNMRWALTLSDLRRQSENDVGAIGEPGGLGMRDRRVEMSMRLAFR